MLHWRAKPDGAPSLLIWRLLAAGILLVILAAAALAMEQPQRQGNA